MKVKHIFNFNGFAIDVSKKNAYHFIHNIFLSDVYNDRIINSNINTCLILVILIRVTFLKFLQSAIIGF